MNGGTSPLPQCEFRTDWTSSPSNLRFRNCLNAVGVDRMPILEVLGELIGYASLRAFSHSGKCAAAGRALALDYCPALFRERNQRGLCRLVVYLLH